MIRILAMALLLGVSACSDFQMPKARPAPSGQTAGNGGGEAALGVVPRGTTTMPYTTK